MVDVFRDWEKNRHEYAKSWKEKTGGKDENPLAYNGRAHHGYPPSDRIEVSIHQSARRMSSCLGT